MSVEPSTSQGADAGEEITTEELLSMFRDQQKRISQLEGENSALRDRVDDLESVVEAQESVLFRGDGTDIENLSIGGIPVGKVIDGNNEARRRLNRTVFGNPAPEMSKHEVDAVVDEHGTVIEVLSQGLVVRTANRCRVRRPGRRC
ncbi:hypothetical protein [Haloarcula sp. JP-L23]|uniref:hypothetical protein n=1 Tax=Haloarcula sp. JP-L23 TaxID=2716717 RepID=UPI00140F4405|nr:hypothetical protein G9465_19280 [Haloarcula sp. JP-L23]